MSGPDSTAPCLAHRSSHELACQKLVKRGVKLQLYIHVLLYVPIYNVAIARRILQALSTEPLIIIALNLCKLS